MHNLTHLIIFLDTPCFVPSRSVYDHVYLYTSLYSFILPYLLYSILCPLTFTYNDTLSTHLESHHLTTPHLKSHTHTIAHNHRPSHTIAQNNMQSHTITHNHTQSHTQGIVRYSFLIYYIPFISWYAFI